jgi:hypothetical protein
MALLLCLGVVVALPWVALVIRVAVCIRLSLPRTISCYAEPLILYREIFCSFVCFSIL